MIGLIKMFKDRSRIRKVAIIEDGAAMLPKTFVEMTLGFPNVLFAAFFTFNKVRFLDLQFNHVYVVSLW